MKIEWFYTNARLNGKTALLAGPFIDIGRAEHYIDVVSPMFIAQEPAAQAATFGVMRVQGFAGYGIYNEAIRAAGDLECPDPNG